MKFRKDINGLRAVAVIAVVLFHFRPSWLSGGFAGVDVFFVISGFLMTGIISRGIEQDNFSLLKFYVARANRIVPALAVLCLALLVFGWFYLAPLDYKELGKHAAGSIGFISNVLYWRESGYFDTASLEKWLLHTWSLSVEWQFYIIYPLVLITVRKVFSTQAIKPAVLILTVLGFVLCVVATYKWPTAAYYLLPARVWEMTIGGVAYLYPLKSNDRQKRLLELIGIVFIMGSYFTVSAETPWPGYTALFPVLGSFFIILAQRNNSLITGNYIFQKVGAWSYSIYLWHWPLVVVIYYFSLGVYFSYVGMILSVFLGYLSYTYIEKIRFKSNFYEFKEYLKCKPLYILIAIFCIGVFVFNQNGFLKSAPLEYQNLISLARPSPYRKECHISDYKPAKQACEYFSSNVEWALLGDSHTVEIAYALANKLNKKGSGLKHFSFTSCIPSYDQEAGFSKCSSWYNEAAEYILNDKSIKNVVLNHRYTTYFFGGDGLSYPHMNKQNITKNVKSIVEGFDRLIVDLSKVKENVYVFYPVPELDNDINKKINLSFRNNEDLENIVGTSVSWYRERNQYIINHFEKSSYPENVHLLKSQDVYCDKDNCFSVKDGVPLYFDNNHPSVAGAVKLIDLID